MYHKYFGLNEQAFSIAVNPRYLFMSQQHKEALAHLLYGVQGGGFVLLSGEVGTGKTTIIKCLLEQLPDNTDIAIVLNPMANVDELLCTICDELGAKYDANNNSIKHLTDVLHHYLLNNHKRGRQTVLLIDEAQLLSADALEQVRLLTNLETTSQKLMQIVLVGQPEINDLLAQPRLRQLSQRISARFHLEPLTLEETKSYIAHRLQVAGMPEDKNPFTPRIIRRIHHFAGGIPRTINILCERTLVGAYGHNKQIVDNNIFHLAKREVEGVRSPVKTRGRPVKPWLIAGSIAACIAIVGVFALSYKLLQTRFEKSSVAGPQAQISENASTLAAGSLAEVDQRSQGSKPQILSIAELERAAQQLAMQQRTAQLPQGANVTPIDDIPSITNYTKAQELLFRYLDIPVTSDVHPCWEVNTHQKQCKRQTLETWQDLENLNRPVVLTLTTATKFTNYAVLIGISDSYALLFDQEGKTTITPLTDLGRKWTGHIFYVWHSPQGFGEPLSLGKRSQVITWVAEQFALIDSQARPLTKTIYNRALNQRVKIFQRAHGLQADGIIGEQTLMKINETVGLDKTLEREFPIADAHALDTQA